MGYSTPYIVLCIIFLILSALSLLSKSNSLHRQVAFLSIVVFVIFFGFRGFVQTDTLNYYNLFSRLPNILEQFPNEPDCDEGFLLYMGIIKLFGFNYQHFILISTIIDIILLTILFRQYFSFKYYPFYLFLFVIFMGLGYEFNLMRNIKSVLLFFISVKYIYSRNFIKFLVLNLVGLSFHWSSLVFFPMYFFIKKELSLKSLCFLFFVGVSIYIALPYFLNSILRFIAENYKGYRFAERINIYQGLTLYASSKAFGLMDIVTVIWYAIIIVTYNQTRKMSSETICFLNLFVIYFLCCCMSSSMILMRQRLAILFEPTCWLLFIWIIKSQNYKSKILLFSIIALYGITYTFRITNSDILYRYDNYILSEEIIPIEQRRETFIKIKRQKIEQIDKQIKD